jgi:hypothetical protein
MYQIFMHYQWWQNGFPIYFNTRNVVWQIFFVLLHVERLFLDRYASQSLVTNEHFLTKQNITSKRYVSFKVRS